MPDLLITDIRFSAAPATDVACGLLGWVSCVLNGSFHIDGISLRRTVDDRLALSFPARIDRTGQKHFFLRPLDDSARRETEHQIFTALGLVDAGWRRGG